MSIPLMRSAVRTVMSLEIFQMMKISNLITHLFCLSYFLANLNVTQTLNIFPLLTLQFQNTFVSGQQMIISIKKYN
jgi:hypothetical protein